MSVKEKEHEEGKKEYEGLAPAQKVEPRTTLLHFTRIRPVKFTPVIAQLLKP